MCNSIHIGWFIYLCNWRNLLSSENLCEVNGGILKSYGGKLFCWKEGMYTRPQAKDFCKKVCGRLPIIHNYIDNEDVGNAAGSVSNISNEEMQNVYSVFDLITRHRTMFPCVLSNRSTQELEINSRAK